MRFNVANNPDIKVKAIKSTLVNQVLGNFVSNAIKYTHPGKQVNVSWTETASRAVISVRDHGIGRPKDRTPTLGRRPNSARSTLGTAGEIGQGFGIQIAEKTLNGFLGRYEIIDHTEKDAGTEVKIYLQKSNLS